MENKPTKVVFALPGKQYSGNFLLCWTDLLHSCLQNNVQPLLSQNYTSVVYYARNKCLGGDNLRGVQQKPFNGEVDYDYIMWIDSDIVFTPEHFFKLLKHNKDIVSGLYMMENNKNFATVKHWDEEFFKKNGYFQFLTRQDIKNKKNLFEVDYTGFGWMLIKKGVFESLSYPWFQPVWSEFQINENTVKDFSAEDVGFCRLVQEKNYKVYVDPEVIVGHEKTIIL